jgi:hypothetical protein
VNHGVVRVGQSFTDTGGVDELKWNHPNRIPPGPQPGLQLFRRTARGGYLVPGFDQPLHQVASNESVGSSDQHPHC